MIDRKSEDNQPFRSGVHRMLFAPLAQPQVSVHAITLVVMKVEKSASLEMEVGPAAHQREFPTRRQCRDEIVERELVCMLHRRRR
jgi:hypothetical protein